MPLRRRPKELSEPPVHFSRHGGGATGASHPGRRRPARNQPLRAQAPGRTDEEARLVGVPSDGPRSSEAAMAVARQIANRLSIRTRQLPSPRRSFAGVSVSAPFRDHPGEIDLERTLELLLADPLLRPEDIFVRQRKAPRRSLVLAVDVSGSARGGRVLTAAAAVGALAGELRDDDLAVLAFWSDAASLLEFGQPVDPAGLVDELMRIPARGLTNVAFPLQLAAEKLRTVDRANDRRVMLLSDCVHNAGPDPRASARRLPRLDVLLDVTGESDLDLGAELARAGRGRLFAVREHRDVAAALSRALA